MRAVVQSSLAFAFVALGAALAGPALAQSDSARPGGSATTLEAAAVDALLAPPEAAPPDEIEEVTVRGRRSLRDFRLDVAEAREGIVEAFNEANTEEDNDVTCRNERPTGSRMPQRICRSNAEGSAESRAARDFLRSMVLSSGGFRSAPGANTPGGPQVNAAIGTGTAQAAGVAGGAAARDRLEAEMKRLMGENRQLYRAVVKYVEVKDEYDAARGADAE